MEKKKLELKKKVISSLSDSEKMQVKGGNITTSFSECTHFICCGHGPCEETYNDKHTCEMLCTVVGTECLPSYCPTNC